jgi:hypothetical protein
MAPPNGAAFSEASPRRRREPRPKFKPRWAREEIGLGVQRRPVQLEEETHPRPRRNSERARMMAWLHAKGWKLGRVTCMVLQ